MIYKFCLLVSLMFNQNSSPRNFKDEYQARRANFTVTHAGHCGACSYLQDLGVYLRYVAVPAPTFRTGISTSGI
jgi:hypothetical protein